MDLGEAQESTLQISYQVTMRQMVLEQEQENPQEAAMKLKWKVSRGGSGDIWITEGDQERLELKASTGLGSFQEGPGDSRRAGAVTW